MRKRHVHEVAILVTTALLPLAAENEVLLDGPPVDPEAAGYCSLGTPGVPVVQDLDDVDHGECPPHVPFSLSCLDEESFGSEDRLWKAVIEGVGNYLIVWGLCLCNYLIVNTSGRQATPRR